MKSTALFRSILGCQIFISSIAGAQVVITDAIREYLASESTVFLLENGRLVDGTGTPAEEGLSVLIENGLISGIGPTESLVVPLSAERVDLSGHTILPGLIFMHEHLHYGPINSDVDRADVIPRQQPAIISKLLLAAGITTVREPGTYNPQGMIEFARRIAIGARVGPELSTGPFLDGPRAILGDFIVETAEDAREVVRFWASRGATVIKVYTSLSAEALKAAAEEAHSHGIQITGHISVGRSGRGSNTCMEGARSGLDSIEHAFGECRRDPDFEIDAFIRTMVENDVALIDTPLAALSEEALSLLTPRQRADYAAFLATPGSLNLWDPDQPIILPIVVEWTQRFVASGGRMLLGTDSPVAHGIHGYSAHSTMIGYATMFSPIEVIRMASSDAAEFMHIDDRTGRIAVGMEADLLVVRGTPDSSMNDIRNVEYVFSNGVAYSPEKLRESVRGLIGDGPYQ